MKRLLLPLFVFSLLSAGVLLGTFLGWRNAIFVLPFLAVGLIGAAIMVLDVDKALFLFLFLMPALHFQDLWVVAGILFAVSVLFNVLTKKQLQPFFDNAPLNWAIIGFNIMVWLSIFFSNPAQIQAISYQIPLEKNIGTFSHYLSDYLFLMIFYFVLMGSINSRQKVIAAIWTIVAFGVVAALFSIFQGSTGLSILPSDEARVKSFFKNSGDYSLYLQSAMALTLGLFWAETHSGRKKLISLMLAALFIGWTFGFVRSSVVSFGLMLLFSLPYLLKRYQARYAIWLVVFMVIILVLRWQQFSFSVQSVWAMIQDPTGTDLGRSGGTSLGFRLAHLRASWEMLRTHPWLGVGFGLSGPALSYYILDPNYEVVGIGQLLHTSFGRVAAETGILGFSFYVLIMGLVLKDLIRFPRAFQITGDPALSAIAQGLLIAFVGHLVTNIGQPADVFPLFWVLMALTTALKRVLDRQKRALVPEDRSSSVSGKGAVPASPAFYRKQEIS